MRLASPENDPAHQLCRTWPRILLYGRPVQPRREQSSLPARLPEAARERSYQCTGQLGSFFMPPAAACSSPIEGYSGGPVEFQSNNGGNRFREACERATVVRMKDSPGLQVGDGLLDPVANSAHRLVEFLFPAEKAAVRRFPDGRQHAVPDVALVTYPVSRVDAVQYAGNLKSGRVMAIPVDRVRDPCQPPVKVAGDLDIEARGLVLAGV